jgi:predicted NUDIX family phosphoesterase
MDGKKALEQVLVIPESQLHSAGVFHGFRPYSEDYLRALLDPKHFSFRPRGEVETDPSFKQLIPYVVLRCRDEIFHYTRGSSGGEERLQSLRSVGIGGHINPIDGTNTVDVYRAGMLRELREEVQIDSRYTESYLGFIFDDRTPVGSVHIGIVHLLELEEALVWPRELAIDDSGFAPIGQLVRQLGEFETWSQFVLEELHKS